MAEDDGDKTEDPTPRRRQQAAEKGQIARSQDLVSAALFVGAMVLLNHFGTTLLTVCRGLLVESLESLSDFSPTSAVERFARGVILCGKALWPLLAGLLLITVVGNVAQAGLRFSPERLQPNLGP
jgi:flagellar biosynthesis protein FlhB